MNIIIIGAAGFIGTNLAIRLSKCNDNKITLVDKELQYFDCIKELNLDHVEYEVSSLDMNMDFSILKGKSIIYHLVSTNMPTNSNINITKDLYDNVLFSSKLFEQCVDYGVGKIVYLSSGGTVYGKDAINPISELSQTNPINSYGLQKLTTEKLLYLYNYLYKINYSIIRLSNPYGPYQRPNGKLGVVTNFVYNALNDNVINVYGDGSVIRDFVYIDDAIDAIVNIASNNYNEIFNFGSGIGVCINEVLNCISNVLGVKLNINYLPARNVDVPKNVLSIEKYIDHFGDFKPISLEEGVRKTIDFFSNRRYDV